jgi:peptide/nickel transport system permease protein
MAKYIFRRVFTLLITLILSSIIIFALTQLLPGNIAILVKGQFASPQEIEQFNERFGLNRPLVIQYLDWASGFVIGDWGISFQGVNAPVRPLVLERFGNSMALAALTLLISIPLSILLGVIAALTEDSPIDNTISVLSLSVVGLPEFVTGIILINIFALGLGWFDTTARLSANMNLWQWLRVLLLPAITASFVLIGYVTRMARAGMIDELKKAYVRTATLKGLPRRTIILRHVLRNALLPTITVIAISVGWLLGGIVVIENVFNYPGMGSELVRAIEKKDIPLLQAITMIIVFIFALANLLADLLYAALNPRIRLE